MAVTRPIGSGKAYSVAQAARLAKTSPANVRNWLLGYQAPGHKMKPVFGPREKQPGQPLSLSFLELAELVVVARFRQGKGRTLPLWRLRAAHQFARERLGIEYPFASGRFKVEGGHVIHEFEESHPGPGRIAVDLNGMYVLPAEFDDALDLFDFGDGGEGLAVRWYPAGKDKPIVIDPQFASGQPSVAGRNVRAEALLSRWNANWSIDEIAEDFSLEPEVVEAAIKTLVSTPQAA